MAIYELRVQDFRCLEAIEFDADPHFNLIYGPNGSGKTSLLEAVAYLGRGKSFRNATTANLIRHGQSGFVLFGTSDRGAQRSAIGVRNGRDGLEVRVDGESANSALLAEALPLQIVEPDIHLLVSGGPEHRRRYLDWLAFHVEHGFLSLWRQFRRALKQRNALLKGGGKGLEVWDREFLDLSMHVDEIRRRVLEASLGKLEKHAVALLGEPVQFEYRPGWAADLSLETALTELLERDLTHGSTQAGPHRADLKLIYNARQARRLVSRGQQKLLASAMILAATDVVQSHLRRPLLLLLDDPAAELDKRSLERLMNQVFSLDSQIIATALEPDRLDFPGKPAVFHVEHGVLRPA